MKLLRIAKELDLPLCLDGGGFFRSQVNKIDWSVFDQYPENTLTCDCGSVFRSHSKFVMNPPHIHARKPCPSCGAFDKIRKASSDPEVMTLSKGNK